MKTLRCLLCYLVFQFGHISPSAGQLAVLEVIRAGVKKVIRAVDLKIQREQNKVIWLQNAQKTIENTMSKLKLDEINDWVGRQKELYEDYYQELRKVKSVISYYHRIRDITQQQAAMLDRYRRAFSLFQSDQHFSEKELAYMGQVYSGMLDQSLKNVDLIATAIASFTTSMTDAKRLELIDGAARQIDEVIRDMDRFTAQNIMLTLQRAQTETDIHHIKLLYGIK